jgi:hypothetical protein
MYFTVVGASVYLKIVFVEQFHFDLERKLHKTFFINHYILETKKSFYTEEPLVPGIKIARLTAGWPDLAN